MAISHRHSVSTVADLGQQYWVAESKPPRALMIRKASDFGEAIRRADHVYSYQTLAEFRPEVEAAANLLIEEVFTDICAMSSA